jgi:hypothetical protein
MGKLIFIPAFIIALNIFSAKAQTDSVIHLTAKQFIQGSFVNFYIDNLSNIYLLNADNQIKKLNDHGDSLAVSNALKRFGNIHSMDVSNSLKIAVYYKDFATIIVLDRFLKNVNTIDLRKYGILQAQAVAISYDNNYWVFDEVDNKLKKIDDNGNLLLSTPDFRTVFEGSFVPDKIIDYNGYVYLYNIKSGCKVFDYYGALKENVAITGWRNIQVFKNSIVGFDDSSIHVYTMDILNENKYLLYPEIKEPQKLQKNLNDMYILQADGLHIYSIN